jgi:hypothetical protein
MTSDAPRHPLRQSLHPNQSTGRACALVRPSRPTPKSTWQRTRSSRFRARVDGRCALSPISHDPASSPDGEGGGSELEDALRLVAGAIGTQRQSQEHDRTPFWTPRHLPQKCLAPQPVRVMHGRPRLFRRPPMKFAPLQRCLGALPQLVCGWPQACFPRSSRPHEDFVTGTLWGRAVLNTSLSSSVLPTRQRAVTVRRRSHCGAKEPAGVGGSRVAAGHHEVTCSALNAAWRRAVSGVPGRRRAHWERHDVALRDFATNL